jgi:hypothetical protein
MFIRYDSVPSIIGLHIIHYCSKIVTEYPNLLTFDVSLTVHLSIILAND